MDDKHIQFGNEGEELVPGKTENLSSALHEASRAPEIDAHLGDGDHEKRQPAQFDQRSGDVGGGQDAAGSKTKADPQVPSQ